MKTKTLAIALATLCTILAGCTTLATHNAQTRAYVAAGQANAVRAKAIAAQVREAVKGVVITKSDTQ